MAAKKQMSSEEARLARENRSINIITLIAMIFALIFACVVTGLIYYMVSNDGENPFSGLSNNANNYLYGKFTTKNDSDDLQRGRVVRSSEELHAYIAEYFNDSPADIINSGTDFNNNDYIAFDIHADDCATSNFALDHIKADRDSIEVQVSYVKNCDTCGSIYQVYLVPIEKNLASNSAQIDIIVSEKSSKSCSRNEQPETTSEPSEKPENTEISPQNT